MNWLLASCAAVLLSSCAVDPAPVQHGLPAVYLVVDSDDVARMRQGTYTKTGVAGDVFLNGRWFTGRITFSGESTIDDLKKGFNLVLNDAGRAKYRLNAMSADPSALRAVLAFAAHGAVDLGTIEPKHVTVFLNRDYSGLYLLHEVIDPELLEERGDRAIAIYAAKGRLADLESTANLEVAFDTRVGTENYADLDELVERTLTTEKDFTKGLDAILDIDSALRYMAAATFTQNGDGITNNYVLTRSRREERFRFWPWDVDRTFSTTGPRCSDDLLAGNALMRRLRADPVSADAYRNHLLELDSEAHRRALVELLNERAAEIGQAHRLDPYLGGAGSSLDQEVRQLTALLSAPLCDED